MSRLFRSLVLMTTFFGISVAVSPAHAQYVYTSFGPGSWGASDTTLGIAGDTIANFESVNLPGGLQVQVSTGSSGSYGPTSTLPNTFNPATDDPSGSSFVGSTWDGSHALVNTGTNQGATYVTTTNWGAVTFIFPGAGASEVGFSLQNMEGNSTLLINGVSQGGLLTLTGLSGNSNSGVSARNGYIRIDATGNAAPITSLEIDNNGNGDGYVFDHLAFSSATPEPGSVAMLFGLTTTIGSLLLRRRRRR